MASPGNHDCANCMGPIEAKKWCKTVLPFEQITKFSDFNIHSNLWKNYWANYVTVALQSLPCSICLPLASTAGLVNITLMNKSYSKFESWKWLYLLSTEVRRFLLPSDSGVDDWRLMIGVTLRSSELPAGLSVITEGEASVLRSDFSWTGDWTVKETSVTATVPSMAASVTDTRLRPRTVLFSASARISKLSHRPEGCLGFESDFASPLPLLSRSKTTGVNLYFLGGDACFVFGALCASAAEVFLTAAASRSFSPTADFSGFLLLALTGAARFCCFSLMISSNDFTPSESEGFLKKDTQQT